MVDVRAIIQSGQIANQSDAPNRSPADKLDQSVVYLSPWSDHHGAAGEFAVAESKEQTRPTINFLFAIYLQWKRPPSETCQANKDGRLVANLSPTAETASTQCSHIRREA